MTTTRRGRRRSAPVLSKFENPFAHSGGGGAGAGNGRRRQRRRLNRRRWFGMTTRRRRRRRRRRKDAPVPAPWENLLAHSSSAGAGGGAGHNCRLFVRSGRYHTIEAYHFMVRIIIFSLHVLVAIGYSLCFCILHVRQEKAYQSLRWTLTDPTTVSTL